MVKVCVASILIGDLPYKTAAKSNHTEYCARHGYNYFCLEQPISAHHPMWQKPELLRRLLNDEFDWVFWMDGDSFFMDLEKDLLSLTLRADLYVSGDSNDLANTGHMLFRNTTWSRLFIDEWLRFRRPLRAETLAQFAPITTHFVTGEDGTYFNDQPPIAILLAGGNALAEEQWFDLFNSVNLYPGNLQRYHQAAEYAPTKSDNMLRAHTLLSPNILPHVVLLLQNEMNSYPDTYEKGDFILHLVTDKNNFERFLRADVDRKFAGFFEQGPK